MTLDQLKAFIKARNESAFQSNLQFGLDASEAGFDAKDLGGAVNHGDGSYTWRTEHGLLCEDGGKLALWAKGGSLIFGTTGTSGSRDPGTRSHSDPLTADEDREKLRSRGKDRQRAGRPSIGETNMTKKPNTRRGAAKTKDAKAPDAEAAKKAARIAADKQAKLEATAKAQEAAAKKLPAFAKEIAHRLNAAETEDKKAADHRVAAAIQLAAAEEQCKTAGIKFVEWFEQNIPDRKYDTVQRLLKAGKAGDANAVAAAIADMRQKNAAANKKHRAGKKASTGKQTKAKGELQLAEERLAALPDQARVELATKVAQQSGLAVVSQAAVETLKKNGATDPKPQQALALYQGMTAAEKLDFFDRLEKLTGYRLVDTNAFDVVAKKA